MNKSGTGSTRQNHCSEQKWHRFHNIMTGYVLRNVNSSDHGRSQHPLLPHHELLEEVDGDIVIRGQVDSDIRCEEIVYFALAAVLRRKLFRRDMGRRISLITNLVHILVVLIHGK